MDELTSSPHQVSMRVISVYPLAMMSPEVVALLVELARDKVFVELMESILRYISEVFTDITEECLTTTVKSEFRDKADSVIAQVLDVWLVEGWQERLRQGEEQQGMRAWLHVGLERMLDLKFGAAGLALLPDLRATADVDTLRATLGATITVDTLDELRAALSS